MNSVIQTEGLSKRYHCGMAATSGLLRDTLARALRSPATLLWPRKQDAFWALKDLSMGVREGEVLGLLGRNGSGKATLLEILSRITRPTQGSAEIHGRVGSLLEMGHGLSSRADWSGEYLFGRRDFGMKKQEIARKFDEIVALRNWSNSWTRR